MIGKLIDSFLLLLIKIMMETRDWQTTRRPWRSLRLRAFARALRVYNPSAPLKEKFWIGFMKIFVLKVNAVALVLGL